MLIRFSTFMLDAESVSTIVNLNSKGVRRELRRREAGKKSEELDFLESLVNAPCHRSVNVNYYPTQSVEELNQVAYEIVQRGDGFVFNYSGDGGGARLITALANAITEHHRVTASTEIEKFMPHIFLIRGGSVDVIADSYDQKQYAPSRVIPHVISERIGDKKLDSGVYTVKRRSLQVREGDTTRFGFMFHNGLINNFFTEYYGEPGSDYGFGRYLEIFGKGLLAIAGGRHVSSELGSFYDRMLEPEHVRVAVDGKTLPHDSYRTILIGCHKYNIFGMKPFHAVDNKGDKMQVLAASDNVSATDILSRFHRLMQEEPSGLVGLEDCTAEKVYVLPTTVNGKHSYALDGELFDPTSNVLEVSFGLNIPFLRYNPSKRRKQLKAHSLLSI